MSEGKLIVKNAKGVIFDLDGTLVDSMNVWKEKAMGFDVEQDEEFSGQLGKEKSLHVECCRYRRFL